MHPKVLDAIHFVVVEHRYWLCRTDVEQRLGITLCDKVPARHARPLREITGCTTEGEEIYLNEPALFAIISACPSEEADALEDWMVEVFLPKMRQGHLQAKVELRKRVIDFVNRFFPEAVLIVNEGRDSPSIAPYILIQNLHVRYSGMGIILGPP